VFYIEACTGVFHETEKDNKAARACVSKCYCIFHSVVDVKFLAYVLNITQRFVLCIISFANVAYFTCI
jgi:hypothetical protein